MIHLSPGQNSGAPCSRVSQQSSDSNSNPNQVHARRRPCTVPGRVCRQHQASDQVQALKGRTLRGDPSKRHQGISRDQHQAAGPSAHVYHNGQHGYVLPSVANARTGNVPIHFTFTGVAVKVKPLGGNFSRLHMCSTIGMSAPKSTVWTGRAPSLVSSMLYESTPTRATPSFLRYSAASRVRYTWSSKYCSVAQWRAHPVSTSTALPRTSRGRNTSLSMERPVRPVARATTASNPTNADNSSSERSFPCSKR